MKKIYLSLFSLIAATGAMAQKAPAVYPMKKSYDFQDAAPKNNISSGSEKAITLWTNDFSVPSQWSRVDNSTGPASGDNWVIGTTAPSGLYPIDPIESTTAANGFALFDSDLMCSNNQNADVRIIAPIVTTGNPNVSLRFESFYRKFEGECYVIASADGVTWTQFPIHQELEVNVATANPVNMMVNLSSVIGNVPTAYVGFRYIGGCDYAWMVDDVKLVTTDDYDLQLAGLYWGSEGYWGPRLPYYQVPPSQVAPVIFGGAIQNFGANTQTDVVFTAAIPSAAFTSSSAASTFTPNEFDTLDVAATFNLPTTIASYVVNATVTSGALDATPLDNVLAPVTFAVTPHTYARESGVMTGGVLNGGDEYEAGNIFDIRNDIELKGIDVYIHPNTNVGAEFYGTVYSINASTGDFEYLEGSDPIVVTAAMLDSWYTIVLPATDLLSNTDGNSYLVTVGSAGDNGATDDLIIGTSGVSERTTSYIYNPGGSTGPWFVQSATPMVRMNFNPVLGLNEETAQFAVNVFPNPAVNEAKVSFELANASDVTITVTDLAGKVVYTNALANSAAGKHSVQINTEAFAGGVYTVNFNTNSAIVSKKLIVKK